MDGGYDSVHLYLALSGGLIFFSLYLLIKRLGSSNAVSINDGNQPEFYSVEIAQRSVSIVACVVFAVSGAYALFEIDDILYGRSKVLLRTACFIYFYFVQDLITMFISYRLSRECPPNSTLLSSIIGFVMNKPLMITHHILFIVLTVPFTEGSMRSYFGDWYVGCLFFMESSTPLLSLHYIFEYVGLKDSFIQQLNGIIFLVTFFIVRILAFPFMYWIFAHRYHNGEIITAMYDMYWFCHSSLIAFFLMQFFWFIAALKKVLRGATRIYSKFHRQ